VTGRGRRVHTVAVIGALAYILMIGKLERVE